MLSAVQLHQYVALRLPSGSIKVEQILPNTLINLGKYGSFRSNQIIGRPFHLTFEILDRSEQKDGRELRVVPATEIHAETLLEEAEPDLATEDGGSTSTPSAGQFDEYGLPSTTAKSNANILDNPQNQKLTMEEIEALKSNEMANPRELISKIMASHSQLDQKTTFSLAKYTLRKQKKYMKRFTVLPLDVATLTDWMMNDKDFAKVMEARNEMLGLLGSWGNVHASGPVVEDKEPKCRYLIVDDTGGLVVAAMAERMGLLHRKPDNKDPEAEERDQEDQNETLGENGAADPSQAQHHRRRVYNHPLATSNTLTLVHANQQPNLSLLRYFDYDPNLPVPPSEPNPHPLHTHLKTLTWLQLLDPEADSTYQEPPNKSAEEIFALKSNHRNTYRRKRRRSERCKSIVDETRAGEFDGLIISSYTNPVSIAQHLVSLLSGGAQIVVYYPHIEPLLELADSYSTARRTAYMQLQHDLQQQQHQDKDGDEMVSQEQMETLEKDFPVDPTLTLGFMVQTARVRRWQVLPGRTHPLMMDRGGAEGYIAVGTRVIPVKGQQVVARGRARQGRMPKRKAVDVEEGRNAIAEADNESGAVMKAEDKDLGEEVSKRVKVGEEDTV